MVSSHLLGFELCLGAWCSDLQKVDKPLKSGMNFRLLIVVNLGFKQFDLQGVNLAQSVDVFGSGQKVENVWDV